MFRADLKSLGSAAPAAAAYLSAFALQEGYNTGWGGAAWIVGRLDEHDRPFTAGRMLGAVMASGVQAGKPMALELSLAGGSHDGVIVKTWPCVVSGLQPYQVDRITAVCNVSLVDPVSFLAEQPVWGAYRSVSAGEMIGGAISLAAGGDGKPTLTPLLPNLPLLQIVESFRDEMKVVPHAIAAGQILGDWLAEFLSLLGLRAELSGTGQGTLVLELLDSLPKREPMPMQVVSLHPEESAEEGGEEDDGSGATADGYGPILIRGHAGFPGEPLRGGLLDNPTLGSARPVVAPGAVGSVLTGPGLGVEEASNRIFQSLEGRYAEMLMLSAISRQPGLRSGDMVRLSEPVHGIGDWQVAGLGHRLDKGTYDNDITLLRGDVAWHPELPLYHPPTYVSGIVDGGQDFDIHEPVPRDRLGRIKVFFPFSPTPTGEEAAELVAHDANLDGRITVSDFDDAQIESFTSSREQWEEEVQKLKAGELADPFPGQADDELTADELATREELRTRRSDALTYLAYQKASADRDHDGVISERDTLISDELSSWMRDEVVHGGVSMQDLSNMSEEERDALTGTLTDSSGEEISNEEIDSLVQEYDELFEEKHDGLSEEVLAARQDAEEQGDRWPPRIPLPVMMPMAGAMHGFITAHRQGDICRVAVHTPLDAEIVGFQYREDRRINTDLAGAVAGLVVEHNYGQSWSGLVFRRTDRLENPPPPDDEEGEEEGEEAPEVETPDLEELGLPQESDSPDPGSA